MSTPKYLLKKTHIFLNVIPPKLSNPISHRLKWISKYIIKIKPDLPKQLKSINHAMTAEEYIGAGLVSYSVLSAFIGYMIFFILFDSGKYPVTKAIGVGIGMFFFCVLALLVLAIRNPAEMRRADAKQMDKQLLYGLKDIILHAKSGGTLYEGMVSVANSDYGKLSEELDIAVREINVGISLPTAIERMIKRSDSEYLHKTGWRLINAIQTGSDLETTLKPIINELDVYQKTQIQNYAKELNLWSLVYMMFSVAIPTIGSTIMVVISAFSQNGVSTTGFIIFGGVCFVFQGGISLFVKTRRPEVQF